MLTQADLEQITKREITPDNIRKQIAHFTKGFPFVKLVRPATTGDGIFHFSAKQHASYINFYDQQRSNLKFVKFVPASGAASRMFKQLFEFQQKYSNDEVGNRLFFEDQGFNSIHYLFTHLNKIAFYEALDRIMTANGENLGQLLNEKEYGKIASYILGEPGLNYGNLPKALLQFHKYSSGSRTAIEEHLVEAALYNLNLNGIAPIHFTISPEHRKKFEELLHQVIPYYEQLYNVQFDITFSIQKPSTDTIAVDENNQPFRNPDGSLLFRPGGHGALLENLGEIDADIIFVKNIDNIVPDRLREPTVNNKKLIGGYLLWIREKVHDYLRERRGMKDEECHCEERSDEAKRRMRIVERRKKKEGGWNWEDGRDQGMVDFMKEFLSIGIPDGFEKLNTDQKSDWLFARLNRPIRVCGMVKNEGEPGGGPFWVMDDHGECSLQIVESSQIDLQDPQQQSIMQAATHFNPVDLVCCTKDYLGNPFHLNHFVDENTGFISMKSTGGRTLKALELPGLWNGAMAKWITVFVEVPIITFNPVKTVNDLLRKEHLD
jgi:hypothetical protein